MMRNISEKLKKSYIWVVNLKTHNNGLEYF